MSNTSSSLLGMNNLESCRRVLHDFIIIPAIDFKDWKTTHKPPLSNFIPLADYRCQLEVGRLAGIHASPPWPTAVNPFETSLIPTCCIIQCIIVSKRLGARTLGLSEVAFVWATTHHPITAVQ